MQIKLVAAILVLVMLLYEYCCIRKKFMDHISNSNQVVGMEVKASPKVVKYECGSIQKKKNQHPSVCFVVNSVVGNTDYCKVQILTRCISMFRWKSIDVNIYI